MNRLSCSRLNNGSRIGKNGQDYAYNAGFQLENIAGGRGQTYDAGGNVTSVGGMIDAMTYTVDDRLQTITQAGVTTTYTYDPEGRRIAAAKAGSERRFVVGPTSGSGLEVIHMITDASDSVKAVFVYGEGRPLMRFGVDANGDIDPATVRLYLEDGSGSVLGLADGSGALTAHFRYDGFGNARSGFDDPAAANHMGSETGGDFRFHGAWLEADTGVYHMRARDYDPETGRFLERDPWEGDIQTPETLHPCAFANNNPYFYSDPSGEFTIIEINASEAIQSSLQGFRTYAVQQTKAYAKDKIIEAFGTVAQDALEALYPGAGSLRDLFKDGAFAAGTKHDMDVVGRVCGSLGLDSIRSLWLGVPIDKSGDPTGNGVGCGFLRDLVRGGGGDGVARPDFVLGEASPLEVRAGRGKSVLLGDLKLSGNSLYKQYGPHGTKQTQFEAIGGYAGRHTYTRTSVFLTVYTGNSKTLQKVSKLIQGAGFRKGVIFYVFAAQKNSKF